MPDGFAVTAAAYKTTLDHAGLLDRSPAALDGLDPADVADLSQRSAARRAVGAIVEVAPLPPALEADILQAWRTGGAER